MCKIINYKEEKIIPIENNTIYKAGMWLIKKMEELGNTIECKEIFLKEIKEQIQNAHEISRGSVVLSSAPTFFEKKVKGQTLKQIFKRHGIYVGEYIFSMTITSTDVIVVDGKGTGRKRIKSFDPDKNKFYYQGVIQKMDSFIY